MQRVLDIDGDHLGENEKTSCGDEKPDALKAMVSLDMIRSCAYRELSVLRPSYRVLRVLPLMIRPVKDRIDRIETCKACRF